MYVLTRVHVQIRIRELSLHDIVTMLSEIFIYYEIKLSLLSLLSQLSSLRPT